MLQFTNPSSKELKWHSSQGYLASYFKVYAEMTDPIMTTERLYNKDENY